MNKVSCVQCGELVTLAGRVSFREECTHCQSDLHTCFNCRFYDESAYNQCRESSAELVKDKERNNYCEYFEPSLENNKHSKAEEKSAQLKAAEALFKKEP